MKSVINTAPTTPDTMFFSYDAIGNLVKDSEAEIDTVYWSVSGKIKQIVRKGGSTMQGLMFDYDPSGNRIAKHVYAPGGSLQNSTYYVRDAQGNIMATYKLVDPTLPSYKLYERDIYGSSRLGINCDSLELVVAGPTCSTSSFVHPLGLKQYELTNHLGNVLATISDRKLPYSSGGATVDFYQPEIISSTDYYPFGMVMSGRDSSLKKYRFGFNGRMKDTETRGYGDTYDYGFRTYSSRFGRFFSIDPLYRSYPWYSSYQFAGNKPIKYIDLDGAEEKNPQDQPSFTGNLAATTYFDVKHGTENLMFRLIVPVPGYHIHADYDVDENGNPIFETKFTLVQNESFLKEAESIALDALLLVMTGKMQPSDILFSKAANENQFLRAFKGILADGNSFYTRISKLPYREKVAEFRKVADETAKENNWARNKALERKNPGRTIFSDKKGTNYSFDEAHGTFEVNNTKGKHLGEIDFTGEKTTAADRSGGHDLNTK